MESSEIVRILYQASDSAFILLGVVILVLTLSRWRKMWEIRKYLGLSGVGISLSFVCYGAMGLVARQSLLEVREFVAGAFLLAFWGFTTTRLLLLKRKYYLISLAEGAISSAGIFLFLGAEGLLFASVVLIALTGYFNSFFRSFLPEASPAIFFLNSTFLIWMLEILLLSAGLFQFAAAASLFRVLFTTLSIGFYYAKVKPDVFKTNMERAAIRRAFRI